MANFFESVGNSSYGTLESLGNKVIDDIIAYFIPSTRPTGPVATSWLVKVGLEKPTAIPLAEAARGGGDRIIDVAEIRSTQVLDQGM